MKPIVVGLDDSPGARAALRWTLTYAKQVMAPVVAVSALELPQIVGRAANLAELGQLEDIKAGATRRLQDMIEEERGQDSPVEVTVHVTEGHPVDVLVKESADAQLLVVGARGAGMFHRLLLGSVSTGVLHHAECSVVIVRN